MSQVIIFTANDGSVSLIYPMSNVYVPVEEVIVKTFVSLDSNIPGVTADSEDHKATHRLATIEEIAGKDCPQGSVWAIADDSNMPDRYFREAWVHDGIGNVSVDMSKGINIHKNYLRQKRAEIMPSLDVAYTRALENNDTENQQVVIARKNALRNITASPDIVTASTPEQLKQAAISILNGD